MLISKEVYPHDLIDVSDVKYITLASGKSGTSTMSRTINENLGPCIHTHGQFEFDKVHIPPGSNYKLPDLFRDIEKYQGQVSIFSIFREPLTKIISNCFQFRMLDHSHDKNQEFRNLLDEFVNGDLSHLLWCPHEDVENFGNVDIYSGSFDHEQGYTVYRNDGAVVYFFLFNTINEWGRQLSDIFCKPVSLSGTNVTNHPDYNPFLGLLRLERDDLLAVYEKTCKDLYYFMQIKTLDEYCDYLSTLFRDRYSNIELVA